MSNSTPEFPFEDSKPNAAPKQGGFADKETSLSLLADGEANKGDGRGRAPTEDSRDHSLSAAPFEAADDASIREFYSQLVSLLTQDNAPAPKKKNRNNLLVALRRRWLPALLVAGIAFVGLIWFLRPRQSTYQASVTLLLPPKSTNNSPNAADPFAPPEDSYGTETELAIIGSENIVKKAMANTPAELRLRGWGSRDVQGAPVQALSSGSPSLISINVTSMDAAASLRLAEEMVRAYISYARRRYEENREENLQITRERVNESGRLLEDARDELRRFKERSGVFSPVVQGDSSSISVRDLENALASARSEMAGGPHSELFMRDSRLDLLRQRLLELQTRYQNILRDFLPSSDRARAAERELRQVQAAVQARSNEIAAANSRRRTQLEASLRAARGRASTLPALEQNLNRLNERVEVLQSAYRSASDRYTQLNLSRGSVAPTARMLNSPGVASSRRTQWTRALTVSLLASIGLGVLGAWLANRLDRSVRTIGDPDELFNVPILGVMPATGGSVHLMGLITKRSRSTVQTATIEACYVTQNNLLAAAKAIDARSILLTSAVPKEGKSQCASNLATALAYGGQRVLLIDADFLHPSQHDILKTSLEPGYAQVLQDEIPLSEAIRATDVPNLHLLAAGKNALESPEDMVSLLRGTRHSKNVEELEKNYDIILIDGPPTMSMADAQLLSNMADSILLVTAENTRQEEVYRARSMLRLAGGLLLGVVINSVNMKEMDNWDLNFTAEAPFANYANTLRQRS